MHRSATYREGTGSVRELLFMMFILTASPHSTVASRLEVQKDSIGLEIFSPSFSLN